MLTSDQFQKAVEKRYEDILCDLEKFHKKASKEASFWGKTHLFLGGFATLFSSISAAFTFLDENKILVATLAILSAILTSLLTFLNPSSKELEFRAKANRYRVEYHEIQGQHLITSIRSLSEKEAISVLKELTSRVAIFFREMGD